MSSTLPKTHNDLKDNTDGTRTLSTGFPAEPMIEGKGSALRDLTTYARQICEFMFMIHTLVGFCHAIYTVPSRRWSSLAIFMSLSSHTLTTFRLRTALVERSFNTSHVIPYFFVLALAIAAFGDMSSLDVAKLGLFFGTAWVMALVSLALRLVESDLE